MRKLWDHMIEVKKGFMLRKEKVYPLLREERREMHEFIKEQLRKEYIRLSNSPKIIIYFVAIYYMLSLLVWKTYFCGTFLVNK